MRLALHSGMRTLVLALAGLLYVLQPTPAATLEKLSWDDLIGKSTAIVRGRVASSSTAFRGSVIYTTYRIAVSEQLKGTAGGTLQVLVPGGTVAGIRQSVSGAPLLVTGSEYVLFLWTARSGATFVMGLTQGVFDLAQSAAGDLMANRKAANEAMLAPGTLRVVQDDPVAMRYDDLKALVASTVSQGTGN
jgi:hypothetical protein